MQRPRRSCAYGEWEQVRHIVLSHWQHLRHTAELWSILSRPPTIVCHVLWFMMGTWSAYTAVMRPCLSHKLKTCCMQVVYMIKVVLILRYRSSFNCFNRPFEVWAKTPGSNVVYFLSFTALNVIVIVKHLTNMILWWNFFYVDQVNLPRTMHHGFNSAWVAQHKIDTVPKW